MDEGVEAPPGVHRVIGVQHPVPGKETAGGTFFHQHHKVRVYLLSWVTIGLPMDTRCSCGDWWLLKKRVDSTSGAATSW